MNVVGIMKKNREHGNEIWGALARNSCHFKHVRHWVKGIFEKTITEVRELNMGIWERDTRSHLFQGKYVECG